MVKHLQLHCCCFEAPAYLFNWTPRIPIQSWEMSQNIFYIHGSHKEVVVESFFSYKINNNP